MPTAPQSRTRTSAAAKRPRRPNAHRRGYCRSAWRNLRATHLSRQPLCVRCEASGAVSAAELVDHINPVRSADDPAFFDPLNLQSLCWSCHSIKTTTEDVGKGRR